MNILTIDRKNDKIVMAGIRKHAISWEEEENMKKFRNLLFVCFLLTLMGNGYTEVKAAANVSNVTPVITTVEDISVYEPNYQLVDVLVSRGTAIMKLDIPNDGFIKIRTVASDFKALSLSNGNQSYAALTTRLYRDTHYIDQVGQDVTASGTRVSDTAPIAVDKGTYYIGLVPPEDTTSTAYTGIAHVAVFYQACPSDEIYQPSTPISRNPIAFNQAFTGFMSDANPVDYYEFKLTNKALVKFSYRTNTNGSTIFTLFNSDDETLVTQSYSGGYVWYNIEKYLEPGEYYCSFASSSRGQTGFKLTKTDYNLTLKYTMPFVKVSTIDDVKEIRFVRGKLTNSELNSSKWYKGTVLADGVRKFGVNKVGYYTIRVTDTYDNMFMKSIYVKKADTKKPGKITFTSYKSGKVKVTGKAEKYATVNIYINGNKNYCFSATANSKGKFSVTLGSYLTSGMKLTGYAVDRAGNKGASRSVTVK